MKTMSRILLVLLLIVALLGIGLQMFLAKGLTAALNQGVFPAIEKRYGLEMSLTKVSVNLLRGTAELEGFTIRNLEGYENPYLLTFDKCRLELDLLSLLKRAPIVIQLAEADGATLVIERSEDNRYNVRELADALKSVESQSAPAPQQRTASPQQTSSVPEPESSVRSAPVKPIPVHIRRIAVDTLVKYVDSGRNKIYALNFRLTGSDLFTVPVEGQPNSLLVLRGSLADDKNTFATDLNAIVEPLTDPKKPSFNATGSILDIDASFLGDLLEKNEMKSTSFSIKPSIACAKGQLHGSRIDLVLNQLKIYDTDIGDTRLKLPLNGTLQRPTLDLTGAIQSLFSQQGLKIGKAMGLRELQKHLGSDTNTTVRGMLISGLTNNAKDVSDSPALQKLIEQIVPEANDTATTNASLGKAVGNALSEQLDKNLEGNEAVKDTLKSLGTSLFGK